MSGARLVTEVVILAIPGAVAGWWAARLRQHRIDWVGHKAKMRGAREAFWRRLFGPIGLALAVLLILAALSFVAGGHQ